MIKITVNERKSVLYPFGSEETIHTCLTVYTSGVVGTIDAHTPSNVFAVYV